MKPDEILEGLILHFRQGLVLRRSGREEEARETLETIVPEEIRRWSEADTTLRADEKKTKLRDIFHRELGRVEDAFLVYELLAERIEQVLIPAICHQVTQEVRGLLAEQFASLPPSGEPAPQQPMPPADPLVEKLGKPLPRAPKRVSFDDVPGMIDMLLDREYERRERQQ